jgi:hypothetical protein
VPQEVDLDEVRFEISQGRTKIYCVQSLKNALWQYLVPQGLVAVVKQFTKRVMRVVASHAGPIREIANKFDKTQIDLHISKQICESEAETLITTSSLQSNSNNTDPAAAVGSGDEEELVEIQAAIADAPFMQNGQQQEPSLPAAAVEDKFSAAVARTILERLRSLEIPITKEVRSLITKTPDTQIERNVSALEEEAATKGLKSPIAAFKYFISNNCQPRNDRQAWWNRAAVALGKQQRDRLIQSVTEYAGEVVVMFTNGRRLSLCQAQALSWEAIAALGEKS